MSDELLRGVIDCDEVNAVEMVILHGLSGELIVFAFDQWHSK